MIRKLTVTSLAGLSVALVFALTSPYTFISVVNTFIPYRTQAVLYRRIDNPDIRIEFQMKNIGAKGYKSRVVQVTPGILWDGVEPADEWLLDKSHWLKVDEDVNKLGLKS